MDQKLRLTRSRGFTLIELLVVIAIIAILVALLLPAVQQVREAARKSQCQDHLHNLAIALHDYEISLRVYPINCEHRGGFGTTAVQTVWLGGILPYIEQKPLYDQINWSEPYSFAANTTVFETPIDLYLCPSDSTTATGKLGGRANVGGTRAITSYKGVSGSNWNWGDHLNITSTAGRNANQNNGLDLANGFMSRRTGKQVVHVKVADVTDGTSNTVVIGEAVCDPVNHNSWGFFNHNTATCGIPPNYYLPLGKYTAGDWNRNYSFASLHPGGVQFALLDGKITFVSENIDIRVYRGLATISGNEIAKVP
jgi:prepilin-type N-terminal cleavage/methylation domain-containing protein